MMSDKNYLSVYAKSFNWAGFFLPKKTYKKCSALYDFCRVADNIADDEEKLEVKEIYNNKFIFKRSEILNNIDVLSGRGVLYPLKSIKDVNGLRPKLIPHYFADYELSLRVKKKGYKLLIPMNAVVYSDENFGSIQEKRKNVNIVYKNFARKSSSLLYSKFFFWWTALRNTEKISLPFRIIKFIILPVKK